MSFASSPALPNATTLPTTAARQVRARAAVFAANPHPGFLDTARGLGLDVLLSARPTASDYPAVGVVVFPSGSLAGLGKSDEFRSALESYVAAGGVLLVFSQQRGVDYESLPRTVGTRIAAWGWAEDNSCYADAAYVDTFHPILASQSRERVASSMDGYFESIPEGSVVLLRRVKNGMPAMFMYQFGQGWVVVSSSYDDWGGYNQSGPFSRAIIRDAITWAINPAALATNAPGAPVSLSVRVDNPNGTAATAVKYSLLSPSRNRVLLEETVALSVAAGGGADVPISYSFPVTAELGIYHVDYELLDEGGEPIGPVAEADTGRVVIAKPPAAGSYRPADLAAWITMPSGESVVAGTSATFRYYLTNRSDHERHFRVYWELEERVAEAVLADELFVAANTTVSRDVIVTPRHVHGFWIHIFEEGGTPQYDTWGATRKIPGVVGAYQMTEGKGFTIYYPTAALAVAADRGVYAPGESGTATATLTSTFGLPWVAEVRFGALHETVAMPGGSKAAPAVVSVSFPFTVSPTSNGYASWPVQALAKPLAEEGRVAQTVWWRVIVERAELRAGVLVTPAWSRTSGNSILWTLINAGNAPVQNGVVRAALVDPGGVALWSAERAVSLVAGGTQQMAFEGPALPAGWNGRLYMTAENGFGQTVRAGSDVSSRLFARADTGAQEYSALEAGELVVTLSNRGNVAEAAAITGSIEGIGVLSPIGYSLLPGESATLRFPFQVPNSVTGGLHPVVLQVPGASAPASTVRVRPPQIELSVEDRPYELGEAVVVSMRNTGGSTANATVEASIGGLKATGSNTLDAGQAAAFFLPPIPSHWAAGGHLLFVSASEPEQSVWAELRQSVQVLGTNAGLVVGSDADTYAPSAPMTASATVTNGDKILSGALLHLEARTPCINDESGPESSFHVDTWDGTAWVERAVRHRLPRYETDVVDLAAHLPDPAGEYKVRIRHVGSDAYPASLDAVALLSQGTLFAPIAAERAGGGDVLGEVVAADDTGSSAYQETLVVRFPAAPNPSLVYRTLEGDTACAIETLWQKDVPLDLAPAALRELSEGLTTDSRTGQYVLSGEVRTRDGAVLAADEKVYQVTNGPVAVTLRTDRARYRLGDTVTASGVAQNLSPAVEPNLRLTVYWRQSRSDYQQLFSQALSLAAGAQQDYSFTTTADDREVNLTAVIERGVGGSWQELQRSEWTFSAGQPGMNVELRVPKQLVRLEATSPRLVVAEEADLDAVTEAVDGELQGSLPFPVVVNGTTYDRFRQSVRGFVELVPDWAPGPLVAGAYPCLSDFNRDALLDLGIWLGEGSAILAAYLGDFDPSVSGYVGYKLYSAGSLDRAGRLLTEDTLVFFWDAPLAGDTRPNRFQLLLARDGLIRIDAGDVFVTSSCQHTGFKVVGSDDVHAFGHAAPFGARIETAASTGPLTGEILVSNQGDYAGTVELDYGRVAGPRTTASLTLEPAEAKTVELVDTLTGATDYSVIGAGDYEGTVTATVVPAASTLAVGYVGDSVLSPGATGLPVTIALHGGVDAPVQVTYTLTGPTGSEVVTRSYDLEPGITTSDALPFELPEGLLTLSASVEGAALTMDAITLTVAPEEGASLTVLAGELAGGVLPISVDVANTGRNVLVGEVEVEGYGGSISPIEVAPGASTHLDLQVDMAGATTGPQPLVVRLVSDAGLVLAEHRFDRDVKAAQVVLVESPAGQAFDVGQLATLRFLLRNPGDQETFGLFRFEVFDDNLSEAFDIGPGQQQEIVFTIPLDDDVEAKTYPGRYTIEPVGAETVSGQTNFQVNGIALDVTADLDKEAYADGDTAHFTVGIENQRPTLGSDYLVRVHYGDFEETRPVTVAANTSLTFDVPLPTVTGEALFLGISHPFGRSLYINTYHVRRADALVLVTLDAQVYAPGAAASISATPSAPGSLTLSGPGGYSETLEATGAVSRSFALPADLPGGTYSVSWGFTSASGDGGSGSVPFDVSGVRVRVIAADLEKGRYESGDSIESRLVINTNQPTGATIRGFTLDPEGASAFLGETAVTPSPETDMVTTHSWPFTSTVAGLHRWVYGIYQQGSDTLLASGSVAFDVGEGAVLGVRTDKQGYPLPTEPVQVSVSAFVAAPVTVQLKVDDTVNQTVDASTTGIVSLAATLSSLSPGPHRLEAVIEAGGYTSRQSTDFEYGTSLPDLVVSAPFAYRVSGTQWKVEATVSNLGLTAAGPSTLLLRDPASGSQVGSADVLALAAGASMMVSLDWNAVGAGGSHRMEAVADVAQSVSEYREDNNTAVGVLEIPEVVVDAVVAPFYPAQTEAALAANVVSQSSSRTFEGLIVRGFVSSPEGVAMALAPVALPPLLPGGSTSAGTPWAVGAAVPGAYTYRAEVVDSSGNTIAFSNPWSFAVEATTLVGGAVTASPNPVSPGSAVTLTGQVENRGNVAISGTAVFSFVASDETIVLERRVPVEVAVGSSAGVESAVSSLDVVVGEYRLDLAIEIGDRTYAVGSVGISVMGESVEATLGADLSRRILVYVGGNPFDARGRARRLQFVAEALASPGAIVRATTDPLEFGKLYRSGQWTTHVIFTERPVLFPLLADELREGVFRGNGLVFVQWGPGASENLEPALGGSVTGRVPGESHTAAFAASDLGPERSLAIPASAVRLTAAGGTVIASWENGVAAALLNELGQGRSVTLAFDPSTVAGTAGRELFAAAVAYAGPDAAQPESAGRVASLAVMINNPTSAAQTVDVSLELPTGVVLAGVDDSPVQVAPPLWHVTVAAGVTMPVRFQLVLPDVEGSYEVRATVRAGGVLVSDQPVVTLVVAEALSGALTDAIASLEGLDVAPGDHGHVQSALALLRVAQQADDDLLGLEIEIRSLAEAGQKLGRVQSADVSGVRTAVGRLLAAFERKAFAQIVGLEAKRKDERPGQKAARALPAGSPGGGRRGSALLMLR